MPPPALSDFLIQLVPALLVIVPALVSFAFVLRRRGRSAWQALLLVVPFVGPPFLFYVLSLPDKSVLDRLAALEARAGGAGPAR